MKISAEMRDFWFPAMFGVVLGALLMLVFRVPRQVSPPAAGSCTCDMVPCQMMRGEVNP